MQSFPFAAGQGIYQVEAIVTKCGEDLVVCIGGGEKAHVGAVALALPRPSLADSRKISASVSVLCVTGHKEDELAKKAAFELAQKLNCLVTVTVGIHLDFAKPADLELLEENFAQLLAAIKTQLTK